MDINKDIKFGLVPPVPGTGVRELVDFVRVCESAGFDSTWFPDHMLFMADKITPEVWSVITAASMVTEKIHMGAIGDPHRIHPAILAHRLATVDQISQGRIFSCLGYGEKMNLDYYGIPWDKPLSRLRESVHVIKSLLGDEILNFKGDFFELENAEVRIKPYNEKGVPIYIAATGPNALRTAGEIGDGWITNAMPEILFSKKADTVMEKVNERKEAGNFEKGIYIFLSIAEDPEAAYSTLDSIKHAIIWPELLKEAGFDVDIESRFAGLEYTKIMPNDKDMIGKFREMGTKYYSRDILENFILYGNPADIISRMGDYINAGVDHFILRDFSPDKDYSFNALRDQIMPYFRNSE